MNLKNLVLTFGTVALAVAGAASSSYKLELASPVTIGDVQLKAGTYNMQVETDKVVFKQGKKSFDVPAKFETNATKFHDNELSSTDNKLKEIHVGGTTTKIIFDGSATPSSAAGAAH